MHKIASVAYRLGFEKEVEVTRRLEARPGNTIVVRALSEKRVYSELELENGRMSKVFYGDVIVGALGRRRALRGFSGEVPSKLRAGDAVQLLNKGGVVGESSSDHKDLGQPLSCEVLGMPVRNGKIVRVWDARLPEVASLAGLELPPVVAVTATCMESGKTLFLTELIQELTRNGFSVAGGKLTGIACRRDLIALEDHGAAATASFLDAGHASTAGLDAAALTVAAKTVIAHLAAARPDILVLEFGDGVIGEYGVLEVLQDPEVRRIVRMHAFCAGDMVGAWGGQRFLGERGIEIDLFSGPVTDNDVGLDFLRKELGKPAINAHRNPEALAEAVMEHLGLVPRPRPEGQVASGPGESS
ncbi:MAG: hypothetical protein HY721_28960 [Planctomycetes bacterium]|nr:hypothetical protein [Planctomycetota bacterium]